MQRPDVYSKHLILEGEFAIFWAPLTTAHNGQPTHRARLSPSPRRTARNLDTHLAISLPLTSMQASSQVVIAQRPFHWAGFLPFHAGSGSHESSQTTRSPQAHVCKGCKHSDLKLHLHYGLPLSQKWQNHHQHLGGPHCALMLMMNSQARASTVEN